jgi:hypothetical protein
MGWQGKTVSEITQIKDPTRNGSRSLQQILAPADAPLVGWAWAPGSTRAGSRHVKAIGHAYRGVAEHQTVSK